MVGIDAFPINNGPGASGGMFQLVWQVSEAIAQIFHGEISLNQRFNPFLSLSHGRVGPYGTC